MNHTSLKQTKQLTQNTWQTPKWLFDRLNDVFYFEFDGASNGQDNLLPQYSMNTSLDDKVYLNKVVFCNPPFDKLSKFITKVRAEKSRCACFLIPFRPETKLWHSLIWPNARIFAFNKRINYVNPKSGLQAKGVAFPSCLVLFGELLPEARYGLDDLGVWIQGGLYS